MASLACYRLPKRWKRNGEHHQVSVVANVETRTKCFLPTVRNRTQKPIDGYPHRMQLWAQRKMKEGNGLDETNSSHEERKDMCEGKSKKIDRPIFEDDKRWMNFQLSECRVPVGEHRVPLANPAEGAHSSSCQLDNSRTEMWLKKWMKNQKKVRRKSRNVLTFAMIAVVCTKNLSMIQLESRIISTWHFRRVRRRRDYWRIRRRLEEEGTLRVRISKSLDTEQSQKQQEQDTCKDRESTQNSPQKLARCIVRDASSDKNWARVWQIMNQRRLLLLLLGKLLIVHNFRTHQIDAVYKKTERDETKWTNQRKRKMEHDNSRRKQTTRTKKATKGKKRTNKRPRKKQIGPFPIALWQICRLLKESSSISFPFVLFSLWQSERNNKIFQLYSCPSVRCFTVFCWVFCFLLKRFSFLCFSCFVLFCFLSFWFFFLFAAFISQSLSHFALASLNEEDHAGEWLCESCSTSACSLARTCQSREDWRNSCCCEQAKCAVSCWEIWQSIQQDQDHQWRRRKCLDKAFSDCDSCLLVAPKDRKEYTRENRAKFLLDQMRMFGTKVLPFQFCLRTFISFTCLFQSCFYCVCLASALCLSLDALLCRSSNQFFSCVWLHRRLSATQRLELHSRSHDPFHRESWSFLALHCAIQGDLALSWAIWQSCLDLSRRSVRSRLSICYVPCCGCDLEPSLFALLIFCSLLRLFTRSDVAQALAKILADPIELHEKKIYNLTGPESLSGYDLAHLTAEVLDEPALRYIQTHQGRAFRSFQALTPDLTRCLLLIRVLFSSVGSCADSLVQLGVEPWKVSFSCMTSFVHSDFVSFGLLLQAIGIADELDFYAIHPESSTMELPSLLGRSATSIRAYLNDFSSPGSMK